MMTLQTLLNNLSPINTKDKVDTLIQEMKKCGIKMTKSTDIVIRCAINKVSIQKYIIEKYSRLFVEKEKSQEILHKKTKEVEQKKKKAKKKKQLPQKTKNIVLPSILRVFGSHKNKEEKPYKEGKVAPHKKEYSTSFINSISAISIPMGGANK